MKKKGKYIASSLIFCILIIGIGRFLRYILIDDVSSYTRITFHEMYEQDNIDVLFVGSSHCYRSLIPEIFDEKWEVNTFNAGTSAQRLDGSYMVTKEAARYNDIKKIYLEMYYGRAFINYKESTSLTETYIISDYLRPSLDKYVYLVNASSKDYYINSFIPARRNWNKIFDDKYIKNLVINKESDDYKNYEYTYVTGDTEWYSGKGYVANNEIVENWNYFSTTGWGEMQFDQISEDWVNSLEDIISFCNKRDISLTLISAPMPNYLLAGIQNYDEYVKTIQNIIDGTNVKYYDFNLCKEIYFPNSSSLFKDTGHMNCYGAEIFSHLLADFINGNIQENELFYATYEEKLENLEPTVFGVSYNDSFDDSGERIRTCKIVSTENDNLEFEIALLPNEEDLYIFQNFSGNNLFMIDPDGHGIIIIKYRLSTAPDETKTVNISY